MCCVEYQIYSGQDCTDIGCSVSTKVAMELNKKPKKKVYNILCARISLLKDQLHLS